MIISCVTGRILNRFAKDLGQLDEVLPLCMYDFIQASAVELRLNRR